MCGIAAIIEQKKAIVKESELSAMTKAVAHRGPDSEGFFLDKNIGLGHRRLSIIDLDDRGIQPMKAYDKIIIFNGEIYNYIEIKELLQKKGYFFKTETDTEVILAAYDFWGKDCVNHFNGMWAFIIYDKKKQIIFGSRDRFGEKPLYYSLIQGKLCFASEIKQFTFIEGWQAKLNRESAFEYLRGGLHNYSENTFFEGVKSLGAGAFFVLDLNTQAFKVEKYYDLEEKVKNSTRFSNDFEAAKSTFADLFEQSIQLRLRSDVPIGTSLSAGLDSTSIACQINKMRNVKNHSYHQKTFTAHFPKFIYDEGQIVKESFSGSEFDVHLVSPTFQGFESTLQQLIWHQDEPPQTESTFAQWSVYQYASEKGIKVMLDGQGADEVLGGYDVFFKKRLSDLLRDKNFALILELYFYLKNHGFNHFNRYRKKNKFTIDFEQNFISERAINPLIRGKTFREESFFQINSTLPALLHYSDRNSMAWGVEARLPFLDYRLVEWVSLLPDEFRMNKGSRKVILREAMKPVLPKSIYKEQRKLGFFMPGEIWIRQNKESYKQKITELLTQIPIFDNHKVIQNFKAFSQTRPFSGGHPFWRLLLFGEWVKRFDVEL